MPKGNAVTIMTDTCGYSWEKKEERDEILKKENALRKGGKGGGKEKKKKEKKEKKRKEKKEKGGEKNIRKS